MEENKKLGTGIIILTIFILLSAILGIITNFGLMFFGNLIVESYDGEVIESTTNNAYLIIDIILRVIFLVSTILIFMKKSLGIYSYFIVAIISIITSIIFNGFSTSIIASLIVPILMAIFIFKKREAFNL